MPCMVFPPVVRNVNSGLWTRQTKNSEFTGAHILHLVWTQAYPAHFNFFIQRQIWAILRNSRYKSSTSPGAIGIVSRRINW